MTHPRMAGADIGGRGDGLRGASRMMLPFVFVLVSLGVLLLVPMYVARNVDPTRSRIITLGAARRTLLQVEAGFAQASALVRAYLVVPDSSLPAEFDAIVSNNDRSFAALDSMAVELGNDSLRAAGARLRERIVRRRNVQIGVLAGVVPGTEYLAMAPSELISGDEVRRRTAAMSDELEEELRRAREEIARTEQLGLAAMALLALLGTGSAIIVLSVAQQFRERAAQERALREAALMLTEAHGLDAVLGRIAAAAAAVNGAGAAYVERLREDDGQVEVAASAGLATTSLSERIPRAQSLTQLAEERGGLAIIESVQREAPAMLDIAPQCAKCGAIVILLRTDRHVHGALALLHEQPMRLRQHRSIRQSRIFAALASLALRNAVMLRTAEEREEELRRVMESRARLIRGFSHDLKNPLGAADGHAALLEDNVIADPAKREESVRRIRRSIGAALALIEDMLELARAEAGELDIHRAEIDVPSLVREVMEDFRAAAELAGQRMTSSVGPDLPHVATDRQRVRQILANLVTNAIKHVPRGATITVGAEMRNGRRGRDPRQWITLSVSDTGPGIPPEKQQLLFREFSRLGGSDASGAGLGLAISANIARRLGGELAVDSAPGTGTTFTLWLPRE